MLTNFQKTKRKKRTFWDFCVHVCFQNYRQSTKVCTSVIMCSLNLDGWKDNIKNLMMRQDGEGWTVSVQEWEIPGLAVASLREVTKGDVGFGAAQWELYLVLKHKYVAKHYVVLS